MVSTLGSTSLGYFTAVDVKILVAMIGAVLIGVAMKADLLLGVANKNALATVPKPFTISAVAFVVCFVAGFSESLVPRFLNTFETSNDLSGRRASGKSSSKPPCRVMRNLACSQRGHTVEQPAAGWHANVFVGMFMRRLGRLL